MSKTIRINDRRRPENYKLRTYMDALKDVQSMTDQEYMDKWLKHCTKDSEWISRLDWIAYLTGNIVREVENLLKEAA